MTPDHATDEILAQQPAPEEAAIDTGRRQVAALLSGALSIFAGMFVLPRMLRGAEAAAGDAKEPAADETSEHAKGPLAKWGMAIDLDLCTACGACVVACRTENNVPCSGPEPEREGTGIYWMGLLPAGGPLEVGERPEETLPVPCMQCDDPPCVKVCPVGATYLTDEGITAQIYDRCIGCRYCEVACPYSVRHFNWGDPVWPESYKSFLNPDVSTRPRGVVEKCTFCHHRIQRVQEEARMAGERLGDDRVSHLTACAEACPAGAIVFGDLNDEESAVSIQHRNPRAYKLLEHLGTKPKVVYLARDRREGDS